MKKRKVAISIDSPTLDMVDAMVDGLTIRSRSQAIETLIAKGIEQQYIKDAVIMIKGNDAGILLEKFNGKSLLANHLEWLSQYGIQNIYLIIGNTPHLTRIQEICNQSSLKTTIIEDTTENGTVPAIMLAKKQLTKNFIVMLGDTLNNFDLTKMIIFHLGQDKIATVGLISTSEPQKYSRVDLEGDRIVEFRNKQSQSHIIDAGIYIFKPTIFKHCIKTKRFFDRDVFPQLCHTNDIKGYFTYGTYVHFGK